MSCLVIAEHDNTVRREHMERGRMAKIRAGKAVTHPPVGYVRLPNGTWDRDADPAVQQGVAAVFRAFLWGRSLRAAVRILTEEGLRVPRRRTGYPLGWIEILSDHPVIPLDRKSILDNLLQFTFRKLLSIVEIRRKFLKHWRRLAAPPCHNSQ